jgi:hypothetical protein
VEEVGHLAVSSGRGGRCPSLAYHSQWITHGEKQSLGNLLLEQLYSFVGEGWEQEDDITLVTLRRSEP